MLNNLGRGLTSIVTDFPTKNMKQISGYHFYPQIPNIFENYKQKKQAIMLYMHTCFKKKLKC